MSTEHLTPEEIIEKKYLLQRLCQNTKWRLRDAMEEYSAQQVDQQTKQLKEERQTALDLLAQCDAYQLPEWLADKIQAFFHQLNQNNEG